MGKRNKNKSRNKQSLNTIHKEEYNLKDSFARLNRYRSSNAYQTNYDIQQDETQNTQLLNSNYAQYNTPNTNTDIIGNNYFRLEDKIESLSNKNDDAHDSLRKEIKQDIKELSDTVKDCVSKKGFWTVVGILSPIILAIVGGVLKQLSISNQNKETIIEMNTTIERSIIPSIETNRKNIEKNSAEIKENTEKILQSQKKK
jgi:hypothetical protein